MSGNTTHPAEAGYPPISCPTMFADGVLSCSIAPGIAKFYLMRFEPNLSGNNEFRIQPMVQIVLPSEGFVNLAVYLNMQVDRMIRSGFISQNRVDELRQLMEAGST
jgi:hypothetical protein